MASNDITESNCSQCGYAMDRASTVFGEAAAARPGDISVCWKCAHITRYADDLALVELTQAEVIDLALDPVFVENYRKFKLASRPVQSEQEGSREQRES